MVTVFTVTMFFSCQDNYEEIQKLTTRKKFPTGVAQDFEMVYSLVKEKIPNDSTGLSKVTTVLTSPLNHDFSNIEFPYYEFPIGLKVVFFDDQGRQSTITADYGIIYNDTKVVDLQGNVVLLSHDGKKLETPQLFWDQKNDWIFTEKAYKFTSPDMNMSGTGIDFNKEFNRVISHRNSGSAIVKE